jgi:2-polyprenyl-3-methyl-5-hydroxy-6-metoxy-1,4-benzoquinol methylase
MRSDRQRRREITDYYLGISADEITSYLTPASFDLWESVARYRPELGIGVRWLEVGGGVGDLAATALDHGYDVLMTDVQPELLKVAAARHPCLGSRLERSDIFDARDVAALAARGPFSIVAALGAVLNHARDHRQLARGFGHLVALAGPGSLLIVDVMLSEMFPGHPASIWADILHVLPGFEDLARMTRSSGLQVLEAHSLYHRYPPTRTFDAEFDERMLRLFLYRARSARRTSDARSVRSLRRARPGSRRRAPRPSTDSSGAPRATRRRRRA